MAVRPTIRTNDVLAYFDRVGDAWKTNATGEGNKTETATVDKRSYGDGALKLGIDAEIDAAKARMPNGAPADKPQPDKPQPRDAREPLPQQPPQQPQTRDPQPAQREQPRAEAKREAPSTPAQTQVRENGAPPSAEAPKTYARALQLGELPHHHGFSTADRARHGNIAESANVARFLRDPGVAVETPKARSWKGADLKTDDQSPFVEIRDRRDRKVDERRREDRADDARALQLGETKRSEAKETREVREHDHHGGGEELLLDEGRGAGAWLLERPAESEVERENLLRSEDALGETHRCRGILEDGTRCLRKPMLGVPYCREHQVQAYAGNVERALEGAVLDDANGTSAASDANDATSSTGSPASLSSDAEPLDGPATDPQVPAYVVTD